MGKSLRVVSGPCFSDFAHKPPPSQVREKRRWSFVKPFKKRLPSHRGGNLGNNFSLIPSIFDIIEERDDKKNENKLIASLLLS